MKRLFAVVLGAAALTACATPFAGQSESPSQALAAAAQKMSQLQSAKFDMNGSVSLQLPAMMAALLAQGGSGAAAGSLAIDVKGSGAIQFPDRMHLSMTSHMGGLTVTSEEILVGGKAYVKNPISGRWSSVASTQLSDEVSQPDPLNASQLLASAKDVKDLGDTSFDGAAVHHYRLTLDQAKLLQKLRDLPTLKGNTQAQQAFGQILQKGVITLEVWFDKSDHLVRQIVSDARLSFNAAEVMQGLNAGRGTQGLPARGASPSASAAATSQVTAHAVIHYHDFNVPVTVSAPIVS
jgi:hypothetical protein